MRYFLPFFFICSLSIFSEGQHLIDSLQTTIANAPNDTTKVWLYRDLYKKLYSENRTEEMIEVASQGLQLSQQLEYPKGIDYMIYYQAAALDLAGRAIEAIPLYEQGLATARAIGNETSAADYFINLGVAHYVGGDLEKALANYLEAYNIYERTEEKEKLAKVLNNIAIIYRRQQKTRRAEEIYLQSYQLKKELDDSLGIAISLQNLGTVYRQLENFELAIEQTEKAVEIYQALNNSEGEASCYTVMGEIYIKEDKLLEAKMAFQKAWKYFENHPENSYTPTALQGLGQVAMLENNPVKAENYFRQSAALYRKFGEKGNLLEVLKGLSQVLGEQGENGEALAFLEESNSLRDSLTEETKLVLMEEMQAKFDVKQKEAQLKISQLGLSQRTRQRNFFMIGAIILALLAMSIFFGLRSRIRANKKIAQQNQEIQRQRILQLEKDKKLTALTSVIEGQEQERMRIANDLHDSLGGLLTSIKSHFNSINGFNKKNSLVGKTNDLIDTACTEVRRVSHNMMPRALAISGLEGALEDLSQDLREQQLNCELEIINLSENIPSSRTVMIYRLIQELTNNILKHAEAKNILLQLIQHDDQLNIVIEDDGKGFDVKKAFNKEAFGMTSVASRVEFLHGEINWDSILNEGTTVNIQVPV